jgi:multicomponent K+:H+ antiporter subunit G
MVVTVTTPVSLMLLARAALYRDRSEGNDGVPPFESAAELQQEPRPSSNT